MLQVNPAAVILAACCAAVLWFISINPVMSVVIKTQARWRILLSRKPRPDQTTSEFGASLIGIIGMTLDVEAKFNSRRKNARIDYHGGRPRGWGPDVDFALLRKDRTLAIGATGGGPPTL
jgi:hypothetical protein